MRRYRKWKRLSRDEIALWVSRYHASGLGLGEFAEQNRIEKLSHPSIVLNKGLNREHFQAQKFVPIGFSKAPWKMQNREGKSEGIHECRNLSTCRASGNFCCLTRAGVRKLSKGELYHFGQVFLSDLGDRPDDGQTAFLG